MNATEQNADPLSVGLQDKNLLLVVLSLLQVTEHRFIVVIISEVMYQERQHQEL